MNLNKSTAVKLQLIYILVALLLSLLGTILEIIVILDVKYKITGAVGDLFYLYLFLIETALFIACFYYFLKDSPKYFSFNLVGAVLAIVGSVLNILTILAHLLLSLPPISQEPYASSWSIWNEISLILIIGIISIPFIIQVRNKIAL